MTATTRYWSVTEVTREIKRQMDQDRLLSAVHVRGEISNFTRHQSGHCYFTLKDENARLRCVMFAKQAKQVDFVLKDGVGVIALGHITMYERDGQVQLYVAAMQQDGLGRLHQAFEQTKQLLQQEGLFSISRKRALPSYPRTIGVVTSPTGAVIRDIITTLERRYPVARILLFPAVVQGVQAVPSIVRAIELAHAHGDVDVLIVGRGGGSLEELWAFNEVAVARAIAQSRIPVIAAVGHETDTTIACFVADVRAATPTAAAELVAPERSVLQAQFVQGYHRAEHAMRRITEMRHTHYRQLVSRPMMTDPYRFLFAPHREWFDRVAERGARVMRDRVDVLRRELHTLRHRLFSVQLIVHHQRAQTQWQHIRMTLDRVMRSRMHQHQQDVHRLSQQLRALNPHLVIQRGYSVVQMEQRVMVHASQVPLGAKIAVMMQGGQLDCTVDRVQRTQTEDEE